MDETDRETNTEETDCDMNLIETDSGGKPVEINTKSVMMGQDEINTYGEKPVEINPEVGISIHEMMRLTHKEICQ